MVSTIDIYDAVTTDEVGRLDESVIPRSESVFGFMKRAAELIGSADAGWGTEFVALEPTRCLGPGMRSGYTKDADLLKAAVAGEAVTPSEGPPIEILHTADAARAVIAATLADTLSHDPYVVGTGGRLTLADVADLLRGEHDGVDVTIEPRDDDLPSLPATYADRLREAVGWTPDYTADEAVLAYVNWLRSNPEKWSVPDVDEVP